jgi:transposase
MTLYVGIDVAKSKHDLAVLSEDGELVTKNFRFQNSYQGFHKLFLHLEQLNVPADQIKIALEDTGHYAYNLINFLRELGYLVFTYNPLLIKEFSRSLSMRKAKTDKKDAVTIARKLRMDTDAQWRQADEQTQKLKSLTRYLSRLTHDRSKYKTHYVRLLDITFPELARIVKDVHSHYVIELLNHYPNPAKIARGHFSAMLKINRLTAEKLVKIQEAARLTIGTSSFALELELLQTLDLIHIYDEKIKRVNEQVEAIMAAIGSPITSITGIGNHLGAVILAEIKSIHNFKNPAQLQAFAGLEPSHYQSGQMDVTGKMVKRGSPYLRYALILAAQSVARFSPSFRAYLAKKLAEGKHYRVAVSHVAKKLIRVIFYLLKNNLSFDEAKLV